MQSLEYISDRLVFVCYHPGAGGEKLSVQISRFDGCQPLQYYFTEQSRTVITNDIFGKSFLVPIGPFERLLEQAKNLSVDLTSLDRMQVVPSHWDITYLEPVFPKSKFIRILSPDNLGVLRANTDQKVMQGKCRNLLELRGYCLMYVDMPVLQSLLRDKKITLSMTIGEIQTVLDPYIDEGTLKNKFSQGGKNLYRQSVQKSNVINVPYDKFEESEGKIKDFLST